MERNITMLATQRKIIFISQSSLEGIIVSGGHSPRILQRYSARWTADTLAPTLQSVISKLATRKVHLLLGEDLAYVLDFPSTQVKGSQHKKREAVFQIVRSQVPEVFTDDQWDYREVEDSVNEKKIIAFVPVIAKFNIISEAFAQIGCGVVSIEPEQISKLRNPDPILGIALKGDIMGKDEDTLTLSLFQVVKKTGVETDASTTAEDVPTPVPSTKWTQVPVILVLLLGIIGTLVVTGMYAYRFLKSEDQDSSASSVEPSLAPSPSPSPSPIGPDTSTLLNLTEYSVQVLNGSGIRGEAELVANLLRDRGFSQISTGNADNYNYQSTTVRIKEGTSSAHIQKEVSDALAEYSVEIDEYLMNQGTNVDIQIIVGVKNEN